MLYLGFSAKIYWCPKARDTDCPQYLEVAGESRQLGVGRHFWSFQPGGLYDCLGTEIKTVQSSEREREREWSGGKLLGLAAFTTLL